MAHVQGNGIRAAQRSVSQRVDALEETIARALMGVNQRFQAVERQVGEFREGFAGLIEMEGVSGALDEFINQKRLQAMRNQAAAEKASLDAGIADGYVYAVETVTDKSIIVGRFVDAQGVVQEPGRYQLITPNLGKEYRDLVIGQKVGFVLPMVTDGQPNGTTFNLDEVYEVNEEKYAKVQADKAAAADIATRAAAAPAPETTTAEDQSFLPETPESAQEEPQATSDTGGV